MFKVNISKNYKYLFKIQYIYNYFRYTTIKNT